jgi:signal transduction histidine kinase/thiol-disulfide isomerase/thioredoxin
LSAIDAGWAVFSLLNLIAIFWFRNWEMIPFHFIWISLTLLYGFRRKAAEGRYRLISEENARLLGDQRQFVQDAAHQLRTPITIALGHAELLADSLDGNSRPGTQELRDIQVVIGELNWLRRIAQSLLLIVAASDPQFLALELVALDQLVTGLIARWRPAADRRWRLGRLDAVMVRADRDRLSLALDALLDNAVRHTVQGDVIELSVVRSEPASPARLIVADSGSGIPEDQLHLIFDRFRTGRDSQSRGTGLGLALVRAVAQAHGGDVTAHSTPGQGSQFELTLPALARVSARKQRNSEGAPLVADQDVTDQGAMAGGTEPASLPAAKGGLVGRVRALVGQHKLGAAIALLLAAAAVVGVATGSLKGAPASSTSTDPSADAGPSSGSIVYSSPTAAPAFTLPALSYAGTTGATGTAGTVSLAQYQGKPLIVNFFASWCAPCQQETPLIASFYKASSGHVTIVGVDGNDTTAKAVAFVRAKGVSYPVGVDPQLITASAYNIVAFPQTFFLDSRHQIVFRVIGAVTRAQLEQGVRLMEHDPHS